MLSLIVMETASISKSLTIPVCISFHTFYELLPFFIGSKNPKNRTEMCKYAKDRIQTVVKDTAGGEQLKMQFEKVCHSLYNELLTGDKALLFVITVFFFNFFLFFYSLLFIHFLFSNIGLSVSFSHPHWLYSLLSAFSFSASVKEQNHTGRFSKKKHFFFFFFFVYLFILHVLLEYCKNNNFFSLVYSNHP